METPGPSDAGLHERRTTAVLKGAVLGVAAILFPIVTLVVVYLLIAGLTTRTESADRSLSLAGYLVFAAGAVLLCGLGGVEEMRFPRRRARAASASPWGGSSSAS